jgi:hypothetical protein
MPIRNHGITPPAFPSSLHESQRKLRPEASDQEIDQANDEALQAGLQASLSHDDGLTTFQKFARETGNTDIIEQANREALEQGLQASRDHASAAKVAVRQSIPEEEFSAQRGIIAKLKVWLKRVGFEIKPNNGNSNNCLIISMLQHVTGNYASDHTDKARHYKDKIVQWSNGKETSSSALHSDEVLTRKLIQQINLDYFKNQQEKYVSFQFVTADMDGNPAIRVIGDGPRIAGILDGGGHYEAFVKSGTAK